MFDRPHASAARAIFMLLLWAIVTEIAIGALTLITDRSLPALLHVGLLYLGSYVPLLCAMGRAYSPDKTSG